MYAIVDVLHDGSLQIRSESRSLMALFRCSTMQNHKCVHPWIKDGGRRPAETTVQIRSEDLDLEKTDPAYWKGNTQGRPAAAVRRRTTSSGGGRGKGGRVGVVGGRGNWGRPTRSDTRVKRGSLVSTLVICVFN